MLADGVRMLIYVGMEVSSDPSPVDQRALLSLFATPTVRPSTQQPCRALVMLQITPCAGQTWLRIQSASGTLHPDLVVES